MKPAILVVDDEPAVCDVLQDASGEHQLKVCCCHQGKEALVLMLTGMGSEAERGADDYVARPFHPRVVVARTRPALRRGGRPVQSEPEPTGWRTTSTICWR